MRATSLFSDDSTLPSPVLVVEDEPLLQQRLRGVLLGLGYAPDALVFAYSLAEARVCLAAQPMALALVDLALPDGNGMALIEQMRLDVPHRQPGGVEPDDPVIHPVDPLTTFTLCLKALR